MNEFWSNVSAGTLIAILSAAGIAAIEELRPLGLHLIIPEDAVIPMSGACPPGWRQYNAANGQYIVAPLSNVREAQGRDPNLKPLNPMSGSPPTGSIPVFPNQSAYAVLSLCQRR